MAKSEREVFEQFLNSELAKKKYKEYMKKESQELDGLTEEEYSFGDWIWDFIDEYGRYAFEIKMEHWKYEDSFHIVK